MMGEHKSGAQLGASRREAPELRLPAVDRAIDLLELLATRPHGLTLTELSRLLKIPKSTTHYLVHTLATRGYIQRMENRRHALGFGAAGLASASMAQQNLRMLAEPTLRRVVARSRLTASISILGGAEAVIIALAKSFQDPGGGIWIGHHLDLHCTAQGKALVAWLSDEKLDTLLHNREFSHYTPNTIVSLTAFKAHLSEVRAIGYAKNNEEQVIGCRAVAAPVFDSFGNVLACVSVRGDKRLISDARFRELGSQMIHAAHDISLQISH